MTRTPTTRRRSGIPASRTSSAAKRKRASPRKRVSPPTLSDHMSCPTSMPVPMPVPSLPIPASTSTFQRNDTITSAPLFSRSNSHSIVHPPLAANSKSQLHIRSIRTRSSAPLAPLTSTPNLLQTLTPPSATPLAATTATAALRVANSLQTPAPASDPSDPSDPVHVKTSKLPTSTSGPGNTTRSHTKSTLGLHFGDAAASSIDLDALASASASTSVAPLRFPRRAGEAPASQRAKVRRLSPVRLDVIDNVWKAPSVTQDITRRLFADTVDTPCSNINSNVSPYLNHDTFLTACGKPKIVRRIEHSEKIASTIGSSSHPVLDPTKPKERSHFDFCAPPRRIPPPANDAYLEEVLSDPELELMPDHEEQSKKGGESLQKQELKSKPNIHQQSPAAATPNEGNSSGEDGTVEDTLDPLKAFEGDAANEPKMDNLKKEAGGSLNHLARRNPGGETIVGGDMSTIGKDDLMDKFRPVCRTGLKAMVDGSQVHHEQDGYEGGDKVNDTINGDGDLRANDHKLSTDGFRTEAGSRQNSARDSLHRDVATSGDNGENHSSFNATETNESLQGTRRHRLRKGSSHVFSVRRGGNFRTMPGSSSRLDSQKLSHDGNRSGGGDELKLADSKRRSNLSNRTRGHDGEAADDPVADGGLESRSYGEEKPLSEDEDVFDHGLNQTRISVRKAFKEYEITQRSKRKDRESRENRRISEEPLNISEGERPISKGDELSIQGDGKSRVILQTETRLPSDMNNGEGSYADNGHGGEVHGLATFGAKGGNSLGVDQEDFSSDVDVEPDYRSDGLTKEPPRSSGRQRSRRQRQCIPRISDSALNKGPRIDRYLSHDSKGTGKVVASTGLVPIEECDDLESEGDEAQKNLESRSERPHHGILERKSHTRGRPRSRGRGRGRGRPRKAREPRELLGEDEFVCNEPHSISHEVGKGAADENADVRCQTGSFGESHVYGQRQQVRRGRGRPRRVPIRNPDAEMEQENGGNDKCTPGFLKANNCSSQEKHLGKQDLNSASNDCEEIQAVNDIVRAIREDQKAHPQTELDTDLEIAGGEVGPTVNRKIRRKIAMDDGISYDDGESDKFHSASPFKKGVEFERSPDIRLKMDASRKTKLASNKRRSRARIGNSTPRRNVNSSPIDGDYRTGSGSVPGSESDALLNSRSKVDTARVKRSPTRTSPRLRGVKRKISIVDSETSFESGGEMTERNKRVLLESPFQEERDTNSNDGEAGRDFVDDIKMESDRDGKAVVKLKEAVGKKSSAKDGDSFEVGLEVDAKRCLKREGLPPKRRTQHITEEGEIRMEAEVGAEVVQVGETRLQWGRVMSRTTCKGRRRGQASRREACSGGGHTSQSVRKRSREGEGSLSNERRDNGSQADGGKKAGGRKRRKFLSEVLKLQKALASAAWTDSREVEAQTEVKVSDDEIPRTVLEGVETAQPISAAPSAVAVPIIKGAKAKPTTPFKRKR